MSVKRPRPPRARRHAKRATTPVVIAPVFVGVPGRARVRVDGLLGRDAFAVRLEARLTANGGIRHVKVSAITGNVLVLFDPRALTVRDLLVALERHAIEARDGRTRDRLAAPAWHAMTPAQVVDALATSVADGLSRNEAARRLDEAGPNQLPAPQPRSALAIVTGHLSSLPVLLLGGAAVLSIATGAVVDAVVILAVVAANAAIGYVTESRVERILTSLQSSGASVAFVRRDGHEHILPAAGVAPGDLLILKPGHDVPADARLVEVDGLSVDESTLTGESAPVVKRAAASVPHDTVLADRHTMVYSGTVVADGRGLAVVVGTGRDTEIGRIRALVAETPMPPTPLERNLDDMGRRLVGVSLGFCGVTLALGLIRGVPALEMLRTAISLAVAAVPEGLPAVATTTLALGVQRMLARNAIVRRLAAVESLGATTIICADKTGTLTENRMTVHAWYVGGTRYQAAKPAGGDDGLVRAIGIAVLCNEAEIGPDAVEIRGSSTEGALLRAATDAGIAYTTLRERYPRVAIRGRGDGDNWMATVHDTPAGRRLVAVKGAPEEVLVRSTRWLTRDGEEPLGGDPRRQILNENAELAAGGMRMLGLAFRETSTHDAVTYDDLVWVGLVALTDPIRAGASTAIEACRAAGIRTIILTGDQAATAAAIFRELHIQRNGTPRVLEASRLAGINAAELHDLSRNVDVFARVSPADKYQVVRALQAGGEVVAMTGDGINDAAALRAADIGVAMGARGTDVARDVADVVLLDDDLGAVVAAIEQGRTIHANVGKALRFLLSTNFSEILVTVGALALGAARPMSAIQFLWINLLSDVLPALALAVEPAEPGVMHRPPRDPAEPMLSRSALLRIGTEGGMLAAATLGAHALALARYGPGARTTTIAFSALTTAQLVHAFNCRSEERPAFAQLGKSRLLAGVVGGSLALQVAAVSVPGLRRVLGTTPLSAGDWALVAATAAVPLVSQPLLGAIMPATRGAASVAAPRKGDRHGSITHEDHAHAPPA